MIFQTVTFENWIAKIESELKTDIEMESYRQYYNEGLTPEEAIELDREGT